MIMWAPDIEAEHDLIERVSPAGLKVLVILALAGSCHPDSNMHTV